MKHARRKRRGFSFSSIKKFDDHIKKSIDGYGVLDDMVIEIARYFVEHGTNVYDIGCSTGRLLHRMDAEFYDKNVQFYGLEKEFNFTREHAGSERVSFARLDVTKGFKFIDASVILSIFTMQFIPRADRDRVLRQVYEGLVPGGAFIFAEKVYCENAQMQDIMTFLSYDRKKREFTSDEILDKERDLRSILRPCTLLQDVGIVSRAGFKVIEVFWRHYNFLAMLCVKG